MNILYMMISMFNLFSLDINVHCHTLSQDYMFTKLSDLPLTLLYQGGMIAFYRRAS
jgi:hypothetical protein